MQKTELKNLYWDIFVIQRNKTPIGLHREGGKTNFSDRGPKEQLDKGFLNFVINFEIGFH